MDKTKNKKTGNKGEDIAAKYLEDKGYEIIERNMVFQFGEIDILARKGNDIIIVEVKSVRGRRFGLAQELVRYKKQQKLILLGRKIEQLYPDKPIRIDILAIDLSGEEAQIEHLENAVTN